MWIYLKRSCAVILALLLSGLLPVNRLLSQSVDLLCSSDSAREVTDKCIVSLLGEIGDKTIVGLGEGTHGTEEFNDVRAAVTKALIQEKGFNYICFENNYGGSFFMNQALAKDLIPADSIDFLLKQNFISLYQTQAVKAFFIWLNKYKTERLNQNVDLTGMDYAEEMPALRILQDNITNSKDFQSSLTRLKEIITINDSLWNYGKTFSIDRKMWLQNGLEGFEIIDSLKNNNGLKIKNQQTFDGACLNLKCAFLLFKLPATTGKELSRDSAMSLRIKQIRELDPDAKIVIWAHNGHISKRPFFTDGQNGGGFGGLINQAFPGQYCAIGTISSQGTYGVTDDTYPTRFNTFYARKLPKPVKNSAEKYLSATGATCAILKINSDNLPDRFSWVRALGYRNVKLKGNGFVNIPLSQCFDFVIYLKNTHASRHL